MSGKRRAIKTAAYKEGKLTGSLQSECDAVVSEYYEKSLSAAAVWERFSISSARVELHLQEKTSSFNITYYLSTCFTLSQAPDKEFKLAKGNTQVIKPAAPVQTQIYTCANCAQVRTNQDAATIECTCCGAQIKGNANMND